MWKAHWVSDNSFSISIEEKHIGKYFTVSLLVRSTRKHHALGEHDAKVDFSYSVLPPRERPPAIPAKLS